MDISSSTAPSKKNEKKHTLATFGKNGPQVIQKGPKPEVLLSHQIIGSKSLKPVHSSRTLPEDFLPEWEVPNKHLASSVKT